MRSPFPISRWGRTCKNFWTRALSPSRSKEGCAHAAYVAAAVSYYRALLDGKPAGEAFSEMRRAYNRGDYTRGLAFGQDARLLSRDVQGHIGESIGEIVRAQGKAYLCKSDYAAEQGDGFKVLRGGKEVGGARFSAPARDGFLLTSPKNCASATKCA